MAFSLNDVDHRTVGDIMIEAVLNGSLGNWSPSVILASFGDALDSLVGSSTVSDRGPSGTAPTGAAASFERALAEEMLRAGDVDPLDTGFDLQNGTVLGKAGEAWQTGGFSDRIDTNAFSRADVVDGDMALKLDRRVGFDDGDMALKLDRRVGFDDGDTSARSSASGGHGVGAGDPAAFWVGDRIVDHPAFSSSGSFVVDDHPDVGMPAGRVFFNGDGRPIVLPSIAAGHGGEPMTADAPADEGDLMILPDGAVLAYDPWTAAVDGDLVH